MPRDLERYEVVKKGEEKTLEKLLEEVGQGRAQKYKIQGCCEKLRNNWSEKKRN